MNRQSRNSKRQAPSSTQPLKLPKLSQSTPSSPNSELNPADAGSNSYPIAMLPYTDEVMKTLYNFLLDVILSFDRTLPSASTDKSFEWVITVRLEIDAANINCLRALQRMLNMNVPRQDSEFQDLMRFSEYLISSMYRQKPSSAFLNEILSPLLEAREDSDSDGPLVCRSILEPLCPTEHREYYLSARRPGTCLNGLKERVLSEGYSEPWIIIIELVILLEDVLSYFQEDSTICQEINSLIHILHTSLHSSYEPNRRGPMSPHPHSPAPIEAGGRKRELSESQKAHHYSIIKQLYQFICSESDTKGIGYLSQFQHVPARSSKTDYYSRIKKPMDLSTISDKIGSLSYQHYNDFLSDLQLMCYNATIFYSHSQAVHRMAISLIQIVFSKLNQLIPNRKDSYPDPQQWLRDTIAQVFTEIKQFKDETGRGLGQLLYTIKWKSRHTDSESTDMTSIEESVLAGTYSRYDTFQKELLLVFRRVQGTFSPSSPEYKAMLKLQTAYFELRDKFCSQLHSPCLKLSMSEFEAETNEFSPSKTQRWIITQKSDYIPETVVMQEVSSDEKDATTKVTVDEPWIQRQTDGYESHDECDEHSRKILHSFTRHGVEYKTADYVYIAARKASSQPHIVQIENIWQTPTGECWLLGLWFYRPEETYHLATKKFFEKEVFKTDDVHMCRASRVLTKCYVMHVKYYSKFIPRGYSPEDVYVCQSKYNVKTRTEKKIKTWPVGNQSESELVLRDTPLQMQRVPSVFVNSACSSGMGEGGPEGEEAVGDESEDGDGEYSNIPTQHTPSGAPRGFSYFDQCVIDGVRFKLGDFVYVQVQDGSTCIVRIDQMWHDKSDNPFFTGPWILKPKQTQHPPTQLFYKKEVIMSTTIDTNPMRSITGKCYVMALKEYCESRPVEYLEKHVFVCVYRYYETGDKEFKKIKTFKSFTLKSEVLKDELYKFDTDLIPELHFSPFIQDFINGKRKFTPLSQSPIPSNIQNIPVRKILPTHGYGMFCSFNRSKLQQQNPNLTVPQLTKMLAAEWRSLTPEEKTRYEKMASERNMQIEKLKNSPGAMVVYECTWGDCDYQFENVQDLFTHVKNKILEQGVCKWGGCHKNTMEFLSASKLLKHVKEAHIRTSSKLILPNQKTCNFVANQISPASLPSSSNYSHSYMGSPSLDATNSTSSLPPLGTQTVLEAIYSSLDYATSTFNIPGRGVDAMFPTHTDVYNDQFYSQYISSLQHPCTQPINDLSELEGDDDSYNPEVKKIPSYPALEELFDSKLLSSQSLTDGGDECLIQRLREYMDQLNYCPTSSVQGHRLHY